MESTTYTVSFFGHRYIDAQQQMELEEKLDSLVIDLINQKNYVEFLVGYGGDFDTLVSSSVRRMSKFSCEFNSAHVLVLPYMRAAYKNNTKAFAKFYDEIEICEDSQAVHPKRAIQICNRSMVNCSHLAVFCIDRAQGGAYQTYKYAKAHGTRTLNLGALK